MLYTGNYKPILLAMKIQSFNFEMSLTGYQRWLLMAMLLFLGSCSVKVDHRSTPTLAINDDGSSILVAWSSDINRTAAREIKISKENPPEIRTITLPNSILSTAYAYNSKDVLIATLSSERTGKLLRRKPTGEIETLFEHPFPIRFVLETEKDKFVFLAGKEISGGGTWVQLEKHRLTQLNEQFFRLATNINIIDGNYFLLEPGKRAHLISILRSPPESVASIIKDNTGGIHCTKSPDLACLLVNENIELSYSNSEIEYHSASHNCKLRQKWRNFRGAALARNGQIAAFLADMENTTHLFILYPKNHCQIININYQEFK